MAHEKWTQHTRAAPPPIAGELATDYRARAAAVDYEARERRRQEIAEQTAVQNTPEQRIQIWERLHELNLPKRPLIPSSGSSPRIPSSRWSRFAKSRVDAWRPSNANLRFRLRVCHPGFESRPRSRGHSHLPMRCRATSLRACSARSLIGFRYQSHGCILRAVNLDSGTGSLDQVASLFVGIRLQPLGLR